MGCGSSTAASSVQVVPAVNTDDHSPGPESPIRPGSAKVAPSPTTPDGGSRPQSAEVVDGGEGRNSLRASKNNREPATPNGAGPFTPLNRSATFAGFGGFNSGLPDPQGIKYCDPEYFTGRLQDVFNYYSRQQNDDNALIDKKALLQMAMDCVEYFNTSLEKTLKGKNPSWPAEKLNAKIKEIRERYLPGKTHDENIECARSYLTKQLQFNNGGVSKTMFFLNFAKAHKMMFTYEDMTLQREQLIEKWNAHLAEKQAKGTLFNAAAASIKGTRSTKSRVSTKDASHHKSHHKSKHSKSSMSVKSPQKKKGDNIFGNLDFGAESSPRKTEEKAE